MELLPFNFLKRKDSLEEQIFQPFYRIGSTKDIVPPLLSTN